jgi:secretion/DNA translocation related TadE-like protein
VVTLAALLVLLALAAAVLGRLLVEQRRVAAAADLAALAGAVAVQHHRPGCAEAAEVAARNGATVLSCAVDGDRVRLEAAVSTRVGPLGRVRVTASAHAGPVGG